MAFMKHRSLVALVAASILDHGSAYSQIYYTVLDHLHDKRTLARMAEKMSMGQPDSVLQLSGSYINRSSPYLHWWKANAMQALGKTTTSTLDSAILLGLPPTAVDSTSPLFAAYTSHLAKSPSLTEPEHRLFDSCMILIQIDQFLNVDPPDEHPALNARNLQGLDRLIASVGWPSAQKLGLPNIGVAIILAHQSWFTSNEFDRYYGLIESACISRKEDWEVAVAVLQQRIRWLARREYDLFRYDPGTTQYQSGTGMLVAIATRMVANRSKQLQLKVGDAGSGRKIVAELIALQPPISVDPSTLAMLERMGMDHPAPLTEDRIHIEIDPAIPAGQVLYRMN